MDVESKIMMDLALKVYVSELKFSFGRTYDDVLDMTPAPPSQTISR